MNRRQALLAFLGGIGAAVCPQEAGRKAGLTGSLLGPSFLNGHKLRNSDWPEPAEIRSIPILIAGAGIAGLSAAWWLQRVGFRDFHLVELDGQVGGNSRWGENAISPYPWGAHYLPLPGPELGYVRRLLSDLGVLEGDPTLREPSYNERYLCFDPQERLFLHGGWQEGLVPRRGTTRRDRDELDRFFARMTDLRNRRGNDGRRIFTLPMAESSRDPLWLELDRISMRAWLKSDGFGSEYLHWYVNYACRDDFGCGYGDTSAWAGLHYFASRTGRGSKARDGTVLTWPEGNGWLVRRLMERLHPWVETGQMVFRITDESKAVLIDIWNTASGTVTRWRAQQLVWAAPSFLLPRVWLGMPSDLQRAAAGFDYAPWLTVNLSLSDLPAPREGVPLSWDNVIYNNRSLGYVTATHQAWRSHVRATVLTYYRPLSEFHPAEGRRQLSTRTWRDWVDDTLGDLTIPHPDIPNLATNLDIFRWGHGMIRPTPGFLFDGGRDLLAAGRGRIWPAHSDLSGISLFEEAQYRGVLAAQRALTALG